jgi:hypothetical protein
MNQKTRTAYKHAQHCIANYEKLAAGTPEQQRLASLELAQVAIARQIVAAVENVEEWRPGRQTKEGGQ